MDHRRLLAVHEPRHLLGVRRVTAEQTVTTERPEVARLRPRLDLLRDFVLLDPDPDRRDHRVDLLLVESENIEHVVVHRVQERPKDLFVPIGKFAGSVVGDPEGGGLAWLEVGPDNRDLGPPETLRRLERSVPGDHDPA